MMSAPSSGSCTTARRGESDLHRATPMPSARVEDVESTAGADFSSGQL